MNKPKPSRQNLCIYIPALAAALLADQWTKYMAQAVLSGHSPFVILPGIFELRYVENRGAAFGILQGARPFFFLLTVLAVCGLLYMLYHIPENRRYLPLRLAVFFLIAGALGNFIDRVRLSYVIDFMYFSLIDFPVFNVADCYITCSAIALMILLLLIYREDELSFFHLPWQNKTDQAGQDTAVREEGRKDREGEDITTAKEYKE